MRTLHSLVEAHNEVVILVVLRVNVGVVVAVSLIAYKIKIGKGVQGNVSLICSLIFKSNLPDLAGVAVVYVHTRGSRDTLALTVYLAVSEAVYAIVVLNLCNAGVLTGIEYCTRCFVFDIEVTVSVADDRATSLSVGIDICHGSLTVSSDTAAILVYTRKDSRVPDVVKLGTGSFWVCYSELFFCNKFSVCAHIDLLF